MSLKWRTERCCENCPFSETPKGENMRRALGEARMDEIREHLRDDGRFECHATIDYAALDDLEPDEAQFVLETNPPGKGGGTPLLCFGSLKWQLENMGYAGQQARIAVRLGGEPMPGEQEA